MIDDSPTAVGKAEDVPAALRQRMTALGRHIRVRRGQMVMAAGLPSDDVALILSGVLRATLFSPAGREVTFRDMSSGEVFGELGALDGAPRSATIVANEDSRLVLVSATEFRGVVEILPGAALWLALRLVRQVRSLSERVFELSALSVRDRLHCELLRMCALAGVADNRSLLASPPTHEALAARIGTHREAVTRELGYLDAIGILSREQRHLRVNDVARLAGIVSDRTGDPHRPAVLGPHAFR